MLFTGSKAPFRLPDYDIAIEDGRARIDSDIGPVGLRLDGKGALRGGFEGQIAAIAPRITVQGCTIQQASVYGKLSVTSEKPHFVGPLRIGGARCDAGGLRVTEAGLQADVTFAQALDGADGTLSLLSGAVAGSAGRLERLTGTAGFTFARQVLTARYDLAGEGLAVTHVRAGRLQVAGRLRSSEGFAHVRIEGDVTGSRIVGGAVLETALAQAQRNAMGTLGAPLLAQIQSSFARESQSSSLDGSFLARRGSEGLSLVVPRAGLRGGSGQSLLAVSRVQVLARAKGLPHITGNFATGGKGLPRITGRMERVADGSLVLRVQMPAYRAADASLAVPEMAVVQARSGTIGFTGTILASGALPGGRAEKLLLPVDGTWSDDTLALWRRCTQVRFDRLAVASLAIDRRQLTVCPARGRPLLRLAGGNLSIAGGLAALNVTGRLGQTPIRIASGPVGFAYPGVITASAVDVSLGPQATASRFRIASLTARAARDIAGTFDGSDVSLYAVPLDLHDVRGNWRYAGGVLSLSDGEFRLEDREQVDRFQPVVAREATLTLKDNVIDAVAIMREPTSDRAIVLATIRHDLVAGKRPRRSCGAGHHLRRQAAARDADTPGSGRHRKYARRGARLWADRLERGGFH